MLADYTMNYVEFLGKELFRDTFSKNDQLFQKSWLIALYALINEYIEIEREGDFLYGFVILYQR